MYERNLGEIDLRRDVCLPHKIASMMKIIPGVVEVRKRRNTVDSEDAKKSHAIDKIIPDEDNDNPGSCSSTKKKTHR